MTVVEDTYAVPAPAVAAPPAVRDDTAAVHTLGLTKIYGTGLRRVTALREVDVTFRRGELVVIMGSPASGKSTLVRTVSGLEPASSGSVLLGDVDLAHLPEPHRLRTHREQVGVLTTFTDLVPTLTVAENVALPTAAAGRNIGKAWFDDVTEAVGLHDDLDHRPSRRPELELRMSLARAVLGRPRLIVGDDVTRGLAPRAMLSVLDSLRRAVDVLRQTVVLVSRDPIAAAYADHAVFLDRGRVIEQMRAPSAARVLVRTSGLGLRRP